MLPRGLLYLVVFGLFLRLNVMTDFTADDFIYHFHYQVGPPDDTTRLLAGPLDVLSSVATHYDVQNGRNVAHALLQLFMLADKHVFDVANSLVLVALAPVLLLHVFRGRPFSVGHEAAVYLALWLAIPHFGQAALWMSGAVNYLWMTLLTLATLLPFRLRDTSRPAPPWLWPLMIPIGLAAGNANENSGGAWITLALLFMVGWALGGHGVPAWAWVGVVSAAVGLAAQVVSPGNRKRAEKLGGTLTETNFFERFPYIVKVTGETSGLLLAIFGVLAVLCVVRARRVTPEVGVASAYVVAGLASGFVMVATPTMPHRSWIWTVAFTLVAIGIAGRAWSAPARVKRALLGAAIAGMTVWGAVVYVQAHESIRQTHAEVAQELRVIAAEKARGNLDVVVTKFRLPTNRYNALAYTGNLRDDPHHSFNRWFARYYGLNSIRIDNPEEMYG